MKKIIFLTLGTLTISILMSSCSLAGKNYTGTATMTEFNNEKKETRKWRVDFYTSTGAITCKDVTIPEKQKLVYELIRTSQCVSDFGGSGPCTKTTTYYKLTRYFYDKSQCTSAIDPRPATEVSTGSTYVVNKEDVFSTKFKGDNTVMSLTCINPHNKAPKKDIVYYTLTPADYLRPNERIIKSMLMQAFSNEVIDKGPVIKSQNCSLDKTRSTKVGEAEEVEDKVDYHLEYKCNKGNVIIVLDMQGQTSPSIMNL